jgi:hypothetical protein
MLTKFSPAKRFRKEGVSKPCDRAIPSHYWDRIHQQKQRESHKDMSLPCHTQCVSYPGINAKCALHCDIYHSGVERTVAWFPDATNMSRAHSTTFQSDSTVIITNANGRELMEKTGGRRGNSVKSQAKRPEGPQARETPKTLLISNIMRWR